MPTLDECCYIYGSVPSNDSICVPEGGQLPLNCIIYNPHDMFTNLTVTWFKSTTEDMSSYESITMASQGYRFISITGSVSMNPTGNCSLELYRDSFILITNNFTTNDNGYYWCQFAINTTYAQPSHHAWFYAGTICNPYAYFRLTSSNELQCAEYDTNTASSTTGGSLQN